MMNLKNTPHIQALLLLLIAMISIQSSGSLAKILFQQFPILTVSSLRLLLGSPMPIQFQLLAELVDKH